MNKPFFIIAGIILILAGFVLYNDASFKTKPPFATESQLIELEDGVTYNISAHYVTKVINGREQKMLAYNGSIPGPTIRVRQGSEITIHFKNDTDTRTLLHSHGVRMENAFDGSQLQQQEMEPGESFSYKLTFTDPGIYWYHPHAQEVYGQGLGLYGAFIVVPKDQNYFPPAHREIPLFLSDIPIENGTIALDKNQASHSLMGHYGNVMLINGSDSFNLQAEVGEVVRLYVVNSANTRPFNFGIKGLKMKLIGGDNGAYEQAALVDTVLLGPSERAIVDVYVPHAGVYELQNKTPGTTYTLGVITVEDGQQDTSYATEFALLQTNPSVTESIAPFKALFNAKPDKRLVLSIDMAGTMMNMSGMGHGGHMMPDGTMMRGSMEATSPDGIEWNDSNQMMNEMSTPESIKWKMVDQDTGKSNMDIDWHFAKDKPSKIRIFNDPQSMHPMQHPVHFHGQRFLVVARDGVEQTNLVWKDTVLVKAEETVDIILDPSNKGEWMAHCHISEHLEAGMMMKFRVE